ncbi:MAG: hypothetical protein R3B06_32800 [Kofleriaceae bacterium]
MTGGGRWAAVLVVAGLGCGGHAGVAAPAPTDLPARVVADFERATLAGPDAWIELFDFAEVGAFEILLRRYDLLGRLPDLDDGERAALAAEDGTPYPPERERRNVGRFYPRLAQRTVGTGGCRAETPRWAYNRKLGVPFEPLPDGHEAYEPLRQRVNAQLVGGGVVGIRCAGGRQGLALVYSPRPTARGYAIITIYDDGA